MVRTVSKVFGIGATVAFLVGSAFIYARSPVVEPVSWQAPPTASLSAALLLNARLEGAEWFAKALPGPEAVAINDQGEIVTGLADGRVVRLTPGSEAVQVLGETHGRPMAIAFGAEETLYIADAERGLLQMSAGGAVTVLANAFQNRPLRLVDDLVLSTKGIIYFTDASQRHPLAGFVDDLLEHQPTGRVFAFELATQKLTQVMEGLSFANGIALSPDESALIVAETGGYRLWRYFLSGPQAGAKVLFADALPGFPDNVRYSPSRQGYWVAIGSPRVPLVDALGSLPLLRRLLGGLPAFLKPKPQRHAYALLVDLEGKPIESLQYQNTDSYSPISCVTEHQGWLYLGSFVRMGMARIQLQPQ